ncbi:helix-turn-helix domain-containing protein [Gordonia polyisoprenivorans]|nr:AraC family transcriptional regulator [Gordonia polyisoprenivorans]OZC30616.1 hypothetical protein CJJ17_03410 [Gordonia polyisoprenivorans]
MGGVGAPSAHLAAARAYVETHLADPGMSAATIASGIALSERQLSRVFAAAGTSVPEYVLDRRLEHAARLLGSPAGATMTVSQAARHAGIASPSHFSRSFTRRFGMGPAEFRRSAQTSR